MRFLYRLAIHALVTAIIEIPSILILYSYGYPNDNSSFGSWAFFIAYNLYFFLIAFSAVGGPVPGQGPRDMSFDLVFGVVSMFIIVAVIGESINWLVEEIRKMKGKK